MTQKCFGRKSPGYGYLQHRIATFSHQTDPGVQDEKPLKHSSSAFKSAGLKEDSKRRVRTGESAIDLMTDTSVTHISLLRS